jgi:hypothetical protein
MTFAGRIGISAMKGGVIEHHYREGSCLPGLLSQSIKIGYDVFLAATPLQEAVLELFFTL